ncbi:MAG: hypothetical protein Q8N44_05535, partial [Rubrivivax sp.]|nr:hypothetical protein [Rubrivivax sp.]
MNILALSGDTDATIAQIRLQRPLSALSQRTGWPLRLKSFHDCSGADLRWADVLIVQRGASRRAWRWLQRMQRSGGAVVYEIDDLLTQMPAHLEQFAAVQAGRTWLLRCLAAADAVAASAQVLHERLARQGHYDDELQAADAR